MILSKVRGVKHQGQGSHQYLLSVRVGKAGPIREGEDVGSWWPEAFQRRGGIEKEEGVEHEGR